MICIARMTASSSSGEDVQPAVDEKPHCGLRQSWSSGTYFTASSIRASARPGLERRAL
jgi:hypothetical protein